MPLIDTQHNILDIKITYRCNNLCLFCVAGHKRETIPDLPAAHIKKLLEDMRPTRDEAVFTGGEPALHPDFIEIVRYARKDLGYRIVQAQSNGRMFAYKKYCEKVVEAGANQFAFSLHGHTAEIHDALTTRPGSFAQTMAGMLNLLGMGMLVVTNTIVTKQNFTSLPDIARLLVKLGVKQFMFSYPRISGYCEENVSEVAVRMSDAAPYLKQALALSLRAGRLPLTEAFTPCIMAGYENCILERLMSKRTVLDGAGAIDDYVGHRMKFLKQKGPRCPECKWFPECEGPWPDYPRYFSWSEFVPVL